MYIIFPCLTVVGRAERGAGTSSIFEPWLPGWASGFMQLREITGKRMISCTYEIGKVVT